MKNIIDFIEKFAMPIEIISGITLYILSFIFFGWELCLILFIADIYRNSVVNSRILKILNMYNKTINYGKVEDG